MILADGFRDGNGSFGTTMSPCDVLNRPTGKRGDVMVMVSHGSLLCRALFGPELSQVGIPTSCFGKLKLATSPGISYTEPSLKILLVSMP